MAWSATTEDGRRPGPDLKLILVAILTSAGWILVDWTRDGRLDAERLITGVLLVLTLLIAWRSLDMFVATLSKYYELKNGLAAFDAKAARIASKVDDGFRREPR